MDLDNINDIEILKKEIKRNRAKMKTDVTDEDTEYLFKKGYWYIVDQDRDYVKIFSDDYVSGALYLSYAEAPDLIETSWQ